MKRSILLILTILCVPWLARAQQNLTAAAADCNTTNACNSAAVSPSQGGATFTVSANASGNTIQFEASGDEGTTWVPLNVTPSNSTTAVTSTTGTGSWQANIAGYTNVRMRMSALVSGSTTVRIRQSTASARTGGGGGGGGAVSSVFTRVGAVVAAANDYNFNQLAGSIALAQTPLTTNNDLFSVTGGVLARLATGTATQLLHGTNLWSAVSLTADVTGLLPKGNLPATTVFTDQTNAYGAFLFDFSASTIKIPQAAGCTTTVNSTLCLDTTNNRFKLWVSAADSIGLAIATPPVGGKCLQSVGTAGLVVEAAGVCASGLTASGNSANQTAYWTTATNLSGVGPGLTGQSFTANNAAPPTYTSPGVAGTDVNAATYTVRCDSATAILDRATTVRFITTTPTVTMPDPTASGCGANFPVVLIASGVTATVNRTTTAVFNIYNGSTVTLAATTFNLTTGQYANITSPDNANWLVRIVSGGASTPAYPVTVTGGVSGGIPYFSSTTVESASPILNTNILIKGGGAGNPPTNSLTTDDGTSSTYTGTGGTKSPVFTGTGTTAGFLDYPQGTTSAAVAPCNAATSICEQAPTAVTSYLVTKPGAAPNIASYKQTDGCAAASCTETFHPVPVLLTTTADFTDSTSTTLQLITGLSTTLPVSKAVVISFHCALLYNQATAAVSDSFGIGITGTAPTQANASGTSYTSTTVLVTGTLAGLASTTPTAVVTFTPSAITTIWKAELDGTIEQPSNATPGVFGVYASTTTGADNFIVKRGSYCSVTYQ